MILGGVVLRKKIYTDTEGIFGPHDSEEKEGSRWWKFRDIKHKIIPQTLSINDTARQTSKINIFYNLLHCINRMNY